MIFHPRRFGYRNRLHRRGSSLIGACYLILIGLMFLAGTMVPGLSIGEVFGRGWPLIVIFTGVITLLKGMLMAPFNGGGGIVGGLIVITVGVLFLIQFWFHIGFNRTWPVLLLVIALSIILRKIVGVFASGLFRRLS